MVDALEGDDLEPAAVGLRKGEVHGGFWAGGRLDLLHALDLPQLGLGLRGFGVLGPEPVDKLHQARDFALLILVGRQDLRFVGLPLLQKGIVIAPVTKHPAQPDLDDGPHQRVEKLAVVGNHQDRSGVSHQVVLKPQHGFQIQMVGGFVQHEQLGLPHEQSGQVRAHHPTAAEFAGRTFEVEIAKAQSLENLFGLGLQREPAEIVEPGVNVVLPVHRLVIPRFEGQHLLAKFHVIVGNPGGQFQDRLLAHRRAFLGEVANPDVPLDEDLALVRFLTPKHQGEQGGLAGSVRPHQTHPIAPQQLKRRAGKEGLSSVGFADFGQRHHSPATVARRAGPREADSND